LKKIGGPIPWRRPKFLIEKEINEELENNGKKKEGMENSPFYRLCYIAVGMRKTLVVNSNSSEKILFFFIDKNHYFVAKVQSI
jgi:hypothetical protein